MSALLCVLCKHGKNVDWRLAIKDLFECTFVIRALKAVSVLVADVVYESVAHHNCVLSLEGDSQCMASNKNHYLALSQL